MKTIKLTKGKEAIVDDADFRFLSQWNWYCSSGGYARRNAPRNCEKNRIQKKILMHRLLGGDPKGLIVDHINGNTLDNRRCNLRAVTIAQSNINKGCTKRNKFNAKGVCFAKDTQRFQASIGVNDKILYLGQYDTVKQAKNAYNQAAHQYHGEFARGD